MWCRWIVECLYKTIRIFECSRAIIAYVEIVFARILPKKIATLLPYSKTLNICGQQIAKEEGNIFHERTSRIFENYCNQISLQIRSELIFVRSKLNCRQLLQGQCNIRSKRGFRMFLAFITSNNNNNKLQRAAPAVRNCAGVELIQARNNFRRS